MCYRCEECGKVSKPGEKQNRIVVETREVDYEQKDFTRTKGWEIVREIKVCDKCKLEIN